MSGNVGHWRTFRDQNCERCILIAKWALCFNGNKVNPRCLPQFLGKPLKVGVQRRLLGTTVTNELAVTFRCFTNIIITLRTISLSFSPQYHFTRYNQVISRASEQAARWSVRCITGILKDPEQYICQSRHLSGLLVKSCTKQRKGKAPWNFPSGVTRRRMTPSGYAPEYFVHSVRQRHRSSAALTRMVIVFFKVCIVSKIRVLGVFHHDSKSKS